MKSIIEATKRWKGFWFVAATYIVGQCAIDFLAWLHELGREGWHCMDSYDAAVLGAKMVVSSFIAIRALQNGSYAEAKSGGAQ